ncbi:hypothetical protein [Candidatus Mycobacterium methanotrophicum]|uniref:Methyltransferase domain-containing protein n=1 Tax=Candidatus Mycobacterium methanotrophicum TaxID=2943498 RepID=A0ABY4QQ40_9MYCO|nr:hypothetical protein [Candidatus Mycobacterium methanotrophicum]UQX13078.1 hypothetical protein M5I08_12580 [Candidatus Mycobacterium methanotrophicum]
MHYARHGCAVAAIDISRSAIDRARRNAQSASAPSISA